MFPADVLSFLFSGCFCCYFFLGSFFFRRFSFPFFLGGGGGDFDPLRRLIPCSKQVLVVFVAILFWKLCFRCLLFRGEVDPLQAVICLFFPFFWEVDPLKAARTCQVHLTQKIAGLRGEKRGTWVARHGSPPKGVAAAAKQRSSEKNERRCPSGKQVWRWLGSAHFACAQVQDK